MGKLVKFNETRIVIDRIEYLYNILMISNIMK